MLTDIQRLYRDLEPSEAVRTRSEGLLSSYLELRPGDRGRLGTLHASALHISFIMEDESRSQDEVAGAVGISPSTLRRWYKKMASVVMPAQS